MYKGTSENAQRRRDALTPSNLMAGEEKQTDEDRRRNLVRVLAQVEVQLAKEPKGEPRKALILRRMEIVAEMVAIRPKNKPQRDLANFFIEACKERMSKGEIAALLARARILEQEWRGAHPDEAAP